MNITKAKYAKHPAIEGNVSVTATIDGEELSIPLDPNNRHWQAIQAWVAEDNKIAEAD
tara:strand:- start:30 stop:203 length:174 start_codon:yes stop_codon:yes gene_type:complete